MTLLKIFALEDTNQENVVCALPEGEHTIGRGVTLNCNDKRISRKHALINICKNVATIKAVHINPCFFKAADGNSIIILTKGTSIELNDDDQFALLADLFWFRVRVINDTDADAVKENISNKISAVNSSNSTIISTSKSEITGLNVSGDNSNVPSNSKRCVEEISTESSKRQKTSNDHKNEKPSTSTSQDKNISHEKKDAFNRSTSDCLNLLLDTSQNVEQNISSIQLINNLNNILEEDYGTCNDKEKLRQKEKVSDETKSTDNLQINGSPNSNMTLKNEGETNKNIAIKEEQPSISEVEENGASTDNVKINNSSNNDMAQINGEETNENVKFKKEKLSDSEPEEDECNKGKASNSNTLQVGNIKKENEEGTSQRKKNEDKGSENKNNQNEASCSKDNEKDNQNKDKKKSRRERCWYVQNCYRKNPVHRDNFSHPGDDDFLSDPEDDRPICPFDLACYRTNLGHRREYKHSGRPAPKPNNGNAVPKRKRKSPKKKTKTDDDNSEDDQDDQNDNGGRRKRKAASKKLYADYDSEDDYDLDDPFIDDASSDEFQLSDDEDDDSTDWDDSQKVDEESQETRRLLKEAKRFTKAKPKKKD